MHRLLLVALVIGCLSPASGHAQSVRATRPNVVLIMTDDLGWADLGSYGATEFRTPSLDRLASEGLRLTEFYANGVTCSPTRAGLISGRYQQRYGIEAPILNADRAGDSGLPAAGDSLPQLLRDHGYATALIGKWHLGYIEEKSPKAHGFDYFFGLKSGYHDYYTHNGGEWLSSSAPLFGRKWTVFEGGIRVPAIVRWSGRIPAGGVSDQVGITMDLTASILAVTGAPVPATTELEGIDLFPVWEGRAPEIERTLFWRAGSGAARQAAVRRGDWKLVVDGSHTYVFDIGTDLGERNDLARWRQDVARELHALLADWEASVDADAASLAPSAD